MCGIRKPTEVRMFGKRIAGNGSEKQLILFNSNLEIVDVDVV